MLTGLPPIVIMTWRVRVRMPEHNGDKTVATAPPRRVPAPQPGESVEQRFQRLNAVWRRETAHLSSYTKIVGHPAFREILALGVVVVPCILRELEQGPNLLVWALPDITGAHPVPAEDGGNIRKMCEAWLRWGRENGYQW